MSINETFKRNYIESIPLSNEIFKVNHFPCKQVKKILLTDDSLLNRTLLRKVLLSIGNFEIIEAESGNQAIKLVKEYSDIDLIFMDFHMPGINGKEAIDNIKYLGYNRNIILLTGLMKEEVYKTMNINYIMIKPITKKTIVDLFKSENIRID